MAKSFVIHTGTPDFNLEYSDISLSRSGNNLIAKITDAQLHLDSGYYWFYYRVAIKLTLYSDADRTNEITSEEKTFITKPKPIDFYNDPNGFAVSENNEKCWFDAEGNYAKNGYFPKNSVDGEVSIDVSTYTGTIYADVLVYGESDSDDTTDMNGDGVADQDCPCKTHGDALENGTFTLWEDVNAGSINIVDNGDNTFTIDATSGSAGIGNDVHLNSIFYKIVPSGTDADDIAYTYDDAYDFESGSKSMSNISITEDCTVYAYVRTYGTEYGTPDSPGGDVRNSADSATDSQAVKYYGYPEAPKKMWVNTGKISYYTVTKNADGELVKNNSLKSSYSYVSETGDNLDKNNKIKPKVKDLLMWRWSGQKAGTNTPVKGFRVYIYKNLPAGDNVLHKEYSVDISSPYGVDTTNEGTAAACTITPKEDGATLVGDYHDIGIDAVNEKNTQYGFYPNNEGFAAKDVCACKVYTYSTMGNGAKIFSTSYLLGRCELFNSAVVWVKTDVYPDVNAGWQEGIPYVKTSDGWKEAESVHVKNSSTTWKEST
jgi:hypothetical protein